MSFVDKVKKILFDEDEVEVPIKGDELPAKASKSGKAPKEVTPIRSERAGFIDYHNEENEVAIIEEDTIKEVVVPKDDEPPKQFNLPVDFDYEPEKTRESRYHDEDNTEIAIIKEEYTRAEREPVRHDYEPARDYRKLAETPTVKPREEKDYHKVLESHKEKEDPNKKPFKVTPVISPVYGILDKNYKPTEIVNRAEKPKVTSDVPKKREFGPVSYNDSPLPSSTKSEKKAPKEDANKEDLKEISSTISEMINDTITSQEVEGLKAESIEKEYLDQNNIEDAFEPTSEFDQINASDEQLSKLPDRDIDEILAHDDPVDVDDVTNSDPDDDKLNDTIETDLFNLIDSMYKSDDSEGE